MLLVICLDRQPDGMAENGVPGMTAHPFLLESRRSRHAGETVADAVRAPSYSCWAPATREPIEQLNINAVPLRVSVIVGTKSQLGASAVAPSRGLAQGLGYGT